MTKQEQYQQLEKLIGKQVFIITTDTNGETDEERETDFIFGEATCNYYKELIRLEEIEFIEYEEQDVFILMFRYLN